MTADSALSALGEALDAARAAYLSAANLGLTTAYNRLKDPACQEPAGRALRRLHEAVDGAVLAAYGWDDLTPPSYENPSEGTAFADEVTDRLFSLNAARAQTERESA
jgi:hypothetical protein